MDKQFEIAIDCHLWLEYGQVTNTNPAEPFQIQTLSGLSDRFQKCAFLYDQL